MSNVKQVIVMRKDLNMRTGKMVAQGSHASMGAILQLMTKELMVESDYVQYYDRYVLDAYRNTPLEQWLSGSFTKICLYVDNEQQLLDIHDNAIAAELNVCLITDSGKTEFNGIATMTALAIGPDFSSKIDPITGHLKLL